MPGFAHALRLRFHKSKSRGNQPARLRSRSAAGSHGSLGPAHCMTFCTAWPCIVNDDGIPGIRSTGVNVAWVFTVRMVIIAEPEQSVGWQVDAAPFAQMQECDTVVVPSVMFGASFEAAV